LSLVCPGPSPNPKLSQSQQAIDAHIISCFPQMKPEKKAFEMTDDEKVLMNILKGKSPIDLNELKGQTGLSNKKWDKAIKGLTKNKLSRVEKTDAGLLVWLA
jgi:lysyl-tRNA synthetase class 2